MNNNPSLYPVVYANSPRKQQAYTQYVYRGLSPRDISAITHIELADIRKWAEDDDWEEKRNETLAEARSAAGAAVGLEVAAKSTEMLTSYMSSQKKLMARLDTLVADPNINLRDVAVAARAASSMFTPLTGLLQAAKITDPPALSDRDRASPTNVQVNILAQLSKNGALASGYGDTGDTGGTGNTIDMEVKQK